MDPWILALNFPPCSHGCSSTIRHRRSVCPALQHLAKNRGDCHLTFAIESVHGNGEIGGIKWPGMACRRPISPPLAFPVNCNLFQSHFNRYLCFVFHSSCGAFNAYISGHFNKLSCPCPVCFCICIFSALDLLTAENGIAEMGVGFLVALRLSLCGLTGRMIDFLITWF